MEMLSANVGFDHWYFHLISYLLNFYHGGKYLRTINNTTNMHYEWLDILGNTGYIKYQKLSFKIPNDAGESALHVSSNAKWIPVKFIWFDKPTSLVKNGECFNRKKCLYVSKKLLGSCFLYMYMRFYIWGLWELQEIRFNCQIKVKIKIDRTS